MEFHQPAPTSVFIPLYAAKASGGFRLVHRSLELDHIRGAYPNVVIVRNRRDHPVRAYIGGNAVAASHIGAYSGGNTYRQKLPSGHALWSMRQARSHADRA